MADDSSSVEDRHDIVTISTSTPPSSFASTSALSAPNCQRIDHEAPLANTPLQHLPIHIQQLLVKGRITRSTCCLSPYRCVLTRHPIHRDATEAHIASLVSSIRESGFDENLSAKSPLIAVRYSKPMAIPSKAAGSSRTTVQQTWGDHPLVYVISGAGRGEAVGQLVQKEPDHRNIQNQQKGLGFHLLNSGEALTAWEIFLLSTSLNAEDPNSRPPNYFERTDQIAFICLELSNRKKADATVCDIATEICFNPFLTELRQHLNLSPTLVPLYSITDTKCSPEVLEELTRSRSIFPYLPPGKGVLTVEIPSEPLDVLDVLIDMATCVNSDRMVRITPEAAQMKQKEALGNAAATPARTEGFLHARAEDQLRHLFKEIVPLESGAVFDVLVIRDLVGIVFGAIQECSRQFRQHAASQQPNGSVKAAQSDASSNTTHQYSESKYSGALNPLAATYWIERIVYEASPGGLLAGLWNFPAASLVILFYIYFVNRVQQFNKITIQENILRLGTALYRCVAELALSLRSCKITLMSSPTATQIRVLEGVSLLFRIALFGSVQVQLFPHHPFSIPPSSVALDAKPSYEVKEFSDPDLLYEFLYTYWFHGLISMRLAPTLEYREAQRQQIPVGATEGNRRHRHWYDSKRLDVAATASRLRQEVEAIMSVGSSTTQQGTEKVRIKRLSQKRSSPGSSNNKGTLKFTESVEVEVVDPSILPMAQPARLEFLSLVFGVTSMLIEKHQCLETPSSSAVRLNNNQMVQVLNVPANMIVLAAIKVALSLIPPHFDCLAPFLVHWVDVRCRLIQWMWKTCRQELCRRAEEKWSELWAKHNHSNCSNAPRLEVRFTSHRQDEKPLTELTLTKLAEVVPEILPGVLQSMTSFYEERSDLPDDRIIRDFFAKWLKSSGEGDLIAHVNALLARPSPPSSNLGGAEHIAKKARHDHNRNLDRLPNDSLHIPGGCLPSISVPQSSAYRHQSAALQGQYTRVFPGDDRASRRPKKPLPGRCNQSDGAEELGDWLETLPYTEKLRLNSLELPDWELPRTLKTSPSDLLRWRPPELLHPFSGNGLKGPPFDPNEIIQIRKYLKEEEERGSESGEGEVQKNPCDEGGSTLLYQPISDLDWKITEGVLKLLRSRGVDTLVSRGRGQVFFLDQMPIPTAGNLRPRGEFTDSDKDGDAIDEDGDQRHRGVAKKQIVKKGCIDTIAQKRYGASFFKPGNPLSRTVEEELTGRIPGLECVRSFLEYSSDPLFPSASCSLSE